MFFLPFNKVIAKEYVPGELIIKYKTTTPTEDDIVKKYNLRSAKKILKQELLNSLNQRNHDALEKLYVAKSDQQDVSALVEKVKQDPEVEFVEPNYILHALQIPNDPSFSMLWGLNNTGQNGGVADVDIDAPEAWDVSYNSGPVVGVIDSGIDYNHEDLKANIWTNTAEANGAAGVDDDKNGYIDDIHGYDFVSNDGDPFDDNGHGTHVAGTIAAIGNNGLGVSGVNYRGKVAALKFLNASGSGSTAAAIRAIQYANLMGFKITNNSWGGGSYSQALYDAISSANNAGNLFIAAAGNDGANNDTTASYPANFNLPNVISVAATDRGDALASFSNYGVGTVHLGAPGVSIFSTVPKGSCGLCDPSGYRSASGTSMATPHVAGAAAFLWGALGSSTHIQIKDKLLTMSDNVGSLSGKTATGKRLNLFNPLKVILTPTPSPTPTQPAPTPTPTPPPASTPTPSPPPTGGPIPTPTPTPSPVLKDTVRVTFAAYYRSTRQLVVRATSTSSQATLTVRYFGTMTYNPTTRTYQLVKNGVYSVPYYAVVTSSLGGSSSRYIPMYY